MEKHGTEKDDKTIVKEVVEGLVSQVISEVGGFKEFDLFTFELFRLTFKKR